METVTDGPETVDCSTDGTDPETACRRIRERGETVRERELGHALQRLEARQSLSERERQVIAELAEQLTAELLSVPESHLRAIEDDDASDRVARVALELFGEE